MKKRLPVSPIVTAHVAIALVVIAPASASAGATPNAFAVAAEVERIAHDVTLWPGFEPLTIPLAIFDGEATHLFRHPSPPEGFAPVAGRQPAAHVFTSRFPAVRANTSAEIGGVVTATVMTDGPPLGNAGPETSPTALAAVALHEAFHVFQRAHHPSWSGNEGDLLRYPFADEVVLTWRRQETEGLRRAIAALAGETQDQASAACWARIALEARRQRFAVMDEPFVVYERASELNEGLAEYVETRAAGRDTVSLPRDGYPAEALRERFYRVGAALALLLDRYAPAWKNALEQDDSQHLDTLLAVALAAATAPACALTDPERAAIEQRARADATAVVAQRAARLEAFRACPEWRLTVEAVDGQPLWPQGFDPLNVGVVPGGLLHTRFVRLGNDLGHIEMLNAGNQNEATLEALTEAAGDHPLFTGVARVTVVGLEEPVVELADGTVLIEAPGLEARFTGATVARGERAIHLRIGLPNAAGEEGPQASKIAPPWPTPRPPSGPPSCGPSSSATTACTTPARPRSATATSIACSTS